MSFSFALPAAQTPATAGAKGMPGLFSAQGAGQGAGDPLGVFGQILAMLGMDQQSAGQIDFKALAQSLQKAKAGAQGDQAATDQDTAAAGAQQDGAAPIDLSALLAAMLAMAPQAAATAQPSQGESAQGDDQNAGHAAATDPAAALKAQLEALVAGMAGQAAPAKPAAGKAEQAKTTATPGLAPPPNPLAAALSAQAGKAAQTSEPQAAIAPVIKPEDETAIAAPQAAVAEAEAAPGQLAATTADPVVTAMIQAPGEARAATPGLKPSGKIKAAPTAAAAGDKPAEGPAIDSKAQPAATERPEPAAAGFRPRTDLAAKLIQAEDRPPSSEDPADPAQANPVQTAGQAAAADSANPLAAPAPVRGSPETVAKLAAQIVKKLDAKTTRFEIGLDPVGLGRVDVKVEIGANGKLHAQMSFDNAAAAADLRGRAGQLREALEQAGFDLKGGSLSFDVAGQGGQGRSQQQQQQGDQPRFAGAAGVFEAALSLGDTPITAPVWAKASDRGVDIRI